MMINDKINKFVSFYKVLIVFKRRLNISNFKKTIYNEAFLHIIVFNNVLINILNIVESTSQLLGLMLVTSHDETSKS
jgi:hypothetical protein